MQSSTVSGNRRCKAPLARSLRAAGFTMLELTIALAIVAVLFAMQLPLMFNALRSYKLSGDARGIAGQIALARMRAAADFTQARLNLNLTAGTYTVELCTTKGASTCSTFAGEGGTQYLSSGNSFGYGSISTPAGTQPTIGQSATILFNSRGIPVDSSGATIGTNVIYLSGGAGQYCAVSVYASSQITVWRYSGSGWMKI